MQAQTRRPPPQAAALHPHLSPVSGTPPPKQLPLVVLLDLDGTLVGRVGTILCEHQLLTSLSLLSGPGRPATASAAGAVPDRVLRDSITARLRYGIIRPNVLKFCKEVGPNVELFVYTASEASWANFFVPCVEAALGVRFNRPIFTRDQCARNMHKSIDRLLPQIARSVRRRYPTTTPANLRDRVLLVDNTPDVMAAPAETPRVVVCPTYGYNYNYDVLRHVPVEVLHTGFARIAPILERYGMFPSGAAGGRVDSYQTFAAAYYRRLSRAMEATLSSNLGQLVGDTFFARLLHAVNAAASRADPLFTDAAVREINRAVGWHPPSATPSTAVRGASAPVSHARSPGQPTTSASFSPSKKKKMSQ